MNTIFIMLIVVVLMFLIERFWPANDLPKVKHWWLRVVLTNLAQTGIVLVAGVTVDRWMSGWGMNSLWALNQHVSLFWQVMIGYIMITFVYYWWHRLRHDSKFFWRLCHQLHHSPRRMEVLMSFYKHPVEISINAVLSSTIVYLLLGCSIEAAALITLATGVAELFYHWDFKTPVWLGPFFQRPESHRVHHMRNHHTNNYSDIPLWDMLFGTYQNPKSQVKQCGFDAEKEAEFIEILTFQDVHSTELKETKAKDLSPMHLLPSCIGCSKRWACFTSRQQQSNDLTVHHENKNI